MKKLKNILYCSILFSCFGTANSLEDVLNKNIYTNPQIKASIENYKASLYALEQANSGYKPSLNFSAEYGKEKTKIASNIQSSHKLNEKQSRIVGSYNLFEGFKTTHEIEEKKSAIEVAKNQVFQKINKISSLIIQVYVEVLRTTELLEIEKKNVANHLETLDKVKLRLEAGDGYESNLRQTKARVKLAQANQLIIKRRYKNSEINYRRFMGTLPISSSMSTPFITFTVEENQIEKLIKKAQKENYNIKIQTSEVTITKSVHQQQQSKFYPTIDLEVSQIWSNNVHGFRGRDDSSKVALVLNYNFYNGGADRASERSALHKSEMSNYSLDDLKLTIEEQIRISLMKYTMLQSQEELINEQLKHLRGTQELYELEYQNNKRTIIDVLNIKQEYTYAQTQKIHLYYDKILAYYEFQSTMGNLVEEFNLDNTLVQ